MYSTSMFMRIFGPGETHGANVLDYSCDYIWKLAVDEARRERDAVSPEVFASLRRGSQIQKSRWPASPRAFLKEEGTARTSGASMAIG